MFVLIAGMGHCGTQWLATVLDRPDEGVVFYHERKHRIGLGNWRRLLRREERRGVEPRFYQPYWDLMWADLEAYRVVGDANSWAATHIPAVNSILPVDRIIYLLRNGIQQIHSIAQARKTPLPKWWYDEFVYRHWRLLGESFKSWEEMTQWEKWCFWWWAAAELSEWLKRQMANVEVFRLEDLTQNVEALKNLVASFGLLTSDLRSWQETDVNRKVRGDRRPSTLWNSWTEAQQEAFSSICGDTMVRLGYEMP